MAFAKYGRILIDVSNFYYRAYFVSKSVPRIVDGKQMSTGGILMTLKMINRIETNYLADGGRLYFLFDNAFSGEERRRDIDPEYKMNRNKRMPQFYRALDYLQLVLMHYKTGYRVVRRAEAEADDLVEPILKSFEGRGLHVLLISNDMDWARGISSGTDWMVRKNEQDVIYDSETFLQKYGFAPTCGKICLYKALLGDESDNIAPGVKGITREAVLDILRQAGSVHSLYMGLDGLNISADLKESLRRARGKVELNERLIRYKPISIDECRESTVIAEYNHDILLKLYKMLGFEPSEVDKRFVDNTPLSVDDFFNGFCDIPRI